MWRAATLLALAALASPALAAAADEPQCSVEEFDARMIWDPCPAADANRNEVQLPLPDPRLQLVFRRVPVANDNFWCSREVVTLGHPPGDTVEDPFSGERPRVEIFGTLSTAGDGPAFYLGKYELTVGQAAAILGLDAADPGDFDFARGFQRLLDIQLKAVAINDSLRDFTADMDRLKGTVTAAKPPNETLNLLATPVRGLTMVEFDELIDRYNTWCLADGACRAKLSEVVSFNGSPGFVRLPSEVEWEYAARGGSSVAPELFHRNLRPHTPDNFEQYLVVKEGRGGSYQVKAVGYSRRPTTGGFYDLLGNVQELTLDPFRPRLTEGRIGGYTARGGSYLTGLSQLSFATRSEVPAYRFRDEGDGPPTFLGPNRDAYTGVRLALGSPVKIDQDFLREVDKLVGRECGDRGIEALVKDAQCDRDPPADLKVICDRLKSLSLELRKRDNELCAAAVRSMLFNAVDQLVMAQQLTGFSKVLHDDLQSTKTRELYGERYRQGMREFRSVSSIYRDNLAAVLRFTSECSETSLKSARRELDDLTAARPLSWQAAFALVEKHLQLGGKGRATPAMIENDYLSAGSKLYDTAKSGSSD